MAASCTGWKTPESTLDFTCARVATSSGQPTAMAIRQPVMLKVFDSEWNSMATSFAPSTWRMLGARYPSKPSSV